jgi:thioredoxin reductase (NADPH)
MSEMQSNGQEEIYDVVIIGGGPAGAAAAIYTARADLSTLIVDKGISSGALGMASKIANYPGREEVKGLDLLQEMRSQAEKFGAKFAQDKVQAVDLMSEQKTVYGNNGTYPARAVVIATGSMGRGRRVEGEERLLGRGISYCATCDAAFFRDQVVAVAGNSDEAVEEALFLTRFVKQVHFFSPTETLKVPEHLADELQNHPKVHMYTNARVQEFFGTEQLEGVRFSMPAIEEQSVTVSGAFVYLQGGKPITDYLMEQVTCGENGGIVVDKEYQTSLPGVFAVGDVLEEHIKQVVVSAAEGAVAGIAVEKYLRGRKKMTVDWSK